jgi:hypothetical protein
LPLDLVEKIECGPFYEAVGFAPRFKKQYFSSLLRGV